jgi:hypothetical protein
VIEIILSYALNSTWTHCSADWAEWDFQSPEGLRLQVRQSAAKQSWSTAKRMRASFSIKRSAGYWQGPIWHASRGRQAEIYVFAWHPIVGDDADHRDASQ